MQAAHPAERGAAQVEAAKKQRADARLIAAAGASQGSSAATAGRGNTSNAQDASRGCSGAGGRRGSRHTALDSNTVSAQCHGHNVRMICSRCGISTFVTNLEWLQTWLALVMLQHA